SDIQFAPELRNAFERIKITPLPITMEEFSKIWTGLSKAYRLSVAYEVSLLEIGPTTPLSLPAPPVQQTSVNMNTFTAPEITEVIPASGPVGTVMRIEGGNFKQAGSLTSVSIGDTEF